MIENLIVRNAEGKDAEGILMLVKKVMDEAPFFPRTAGEFSFTTEQEAEYIEKAALFLVAEVEGKIIGSATLDRSALSKLNHTVTFGITILKDYCGLGIGSQLMKNVIEWSELNGVEKIDLEVFENNTSGIALYKKFGFLEEGRKRKAIKTKNGYQDLVLMGKFLEV